MSRRLKLLSISVAAAGVIAALLAGTVFADSPNGSAGTGQYCGGETGWMGYHGQGAICYQVSGLLGLTPEEIHTRLQDGESLVEIAAAQGIGEDALVQAILADRTEFIQQRVDAGYMTREQADLMIQQMEQNIRQLINQPGFGSLGDDEYCGYGQNGWGMMGPGGMMGGYGAYGHESCYGGTGADAGATGQTPYGGTGFGQARGGMGFGMGGMMGWGGRYN